MTLITEQHQELRLQLEQHSILTSESNKERFSKAGGIQMSEIDCQSNLIGYNYKWCYQDVTFGIN